MKKISFKKTSKFYRVVLIFIIVVLLIFGCGCAKKEDTSQDAAADYKKIELPLADIVSDDVSQVVFTLLGSSGYECTKSYTDSDTVKKIVDFLNNAPISSDKTYDNANVGSNDPYAVQLSNADGDLKYALSFTDKHTDGYYCSVQDAVNDIKKEFYVDSEYLYPLIEHIATLDARTADWNYSRPFEKLIDRDNISEVKIEYDGKITSYTDYESITRCTQQFVSFACTDATESWNDRIQKTCVVSFFDKDGAPVCKFETNGYIVGDNFQLRLDDKTVYFVNKKQFGFFEEIMK